MPGASPPAATPFALAAAVLVAGAATVSAQQLRVGDGRGELGALVEIPLLLTSPDPVQGLQMIVEWGGGVTGETLTRGPIPSSLEPYGLLGLRGNSSSPSLRAMSWPALSTFTSSDGLPSLRP